MTILGLAGVLFYENEQTDKMDILDAQGSSQSNSR